MNPADYAKNGITEVRIASTMDGSMEPSLFYPAFGTAPRPLLVGLHTWSCDRHNQVDALVPMARQNNWHLILPEFRGPNLDTNPRAREACGSLLARQDIVDAVDWACANYAVDRSAILLYGCSGGGHMALMMAGYRPTLWRSVAAFVGITDVEAWHGENPNYARHIAACCGGVPSDATHAEYRERSPVTHAAAIAKSDTVIYHGKYDNSVPVEQALRLYPLIQAADRSGRVYLRIFDGGHDTLLDETVAQFNAALARTDVRRQDVTG